MNGYMGKILRVDLAKKSTKEETVDEKTLRNFLGGRGLALKILMDEMDPTIDPLAPESKYIFMTGPITGTRAPLSGRFTGCFKSPLTGTYASTVAGGRTSAAIKQAGYDGVIIEGAADEPTYLHITDEAVEFHDASDLWGKLTSETDKILRERHGKRAGYLYIGPAGENLVNYANVMVDIDSALGRSGGGAVLGSKKLKAVVFDGKQKIEVANEEKFKEAADVAARLIREKPVTGEGLVSRGTSILVHVINMHGLYPVKNFAKTGEWDYDDADQTSGELQREHMLSRRGCYGCQVACHRNVLVDGKEYAGVEYEMMWSFGADCDNRDYPTIVKCHNLCNDYGMDGISMGATLACAMELTEKGKANIAKWGDTEAMIDLVHKTGKREGIGEDLALGSKRLAEKYGAPELSMSVKGLELPAYDPRGAQGQGVSYATNARGGCHVRGYMISPEVLGIPKELLDRFSTDDKGRWAAEIQNLSACIDSSVYCLFASFSMMADNFAECVAHATGWDMDTLEYLRCGERIVNLERMFNLKAGLSGAGEDILPDRLLKEPIPRGPGKGRVNRLKKMLKEYYMIRGWSPEGVPEDWKLKMLGLEKYALEG
jgi:aldehyde:ferredoxin oxidoreductase